MAIRVDTRTLLGVHLLPPILRPALPRAPVLAKLPAPQHCPEISL